MRKGSKAPWPQKGQRVLCAVSGGLDSMCLLHMLTMRCGNDRVLAAHFNHQLRPDDADRDEVFVRQYCAAQGIPFACGRGDVAVFARERGRSLEEAARMLRYEFLRTQAAEAGGLPIYTAHHADDNAETILLNLIRGTGVAGLTGMDWEQGGICRPLLDWTRTELEAYAAHHQIPHVEDATNHDPNAAARNLLRLRVMPLLKELNPQAVTHINAAASRLKDVDDALKAEARRCAAQAEMTPGSIRIAGKVLQEASLPVRSRVLMELWERLGGIGCQDLGAAHLEGLLALAASPKPGGLDLPHGRKAWWDGKLLTLQIRGQLKETVLTLNQPVDWGGYTITLLDDPAGAGIPLVCGEGASVTVAPCRPGQRLYLPGAKGGRTVKRLCVDRGISLEERDGLPAIYVENCLAAVWRLGVNTKPAPEGTPCRFVQIIKKGEAT